MFDYFLKEGETPEEFEDRVCLDKLKGKIRTWDDVADIINSALNQKKGESSYRKAFKKRKRERFLNASLKAEEINSPLPTEALGENIPEDELYKKITDYRDWANHRRRILRDEARIERIIEALREPIAALPPLVVRKPMLRGSSEAVLILSDWHYGDSIDNFYNKFNTSICHERIEKLLNETLKYCSLNSVGRLHILNLGDMFAGNIHVSNRVTAEFDVITQIKQVGEELAGFLNELSNEINEVNYYSVTDNHSRTNKNYQEHIEKESLGLLIDWWLKEKLKESNIKIIEEKLDESFGYLELKNGKNVFFTHGHLDRGINNVVQNYTLSSGKIAHYVCLGHWHHKKEKEYQGSKVIVNGSLRGVDEYALNNRLFSKPSQTLLVFDNENEVDISINLG